MASDTGGRLTVEAVSDRRRLDDFIRVPWHVYADDPNWVPPLIIERRAHLGAKNPYFRHAEARYWVAYRGSRPVGRISAQIDRLAQDRHGADLGHFGLFEALDDDAAITALLEAAESWLAGKGARRVLGPFSLSINDECGLLVDGFGTPPMLLMGHARSYYGPRLEAQGYAKAKDLIAYSYDTESPLPLSTRRLADRALETPGLVLRELRRDRLREELGMIVDIFNDAWVDNWGFVPMTEAEVDHMAASMKPVIRPDLVSIAEVNGEPAAMIVALPNLNEAIADLDGRLLPFGAAKLLWRLKVRELSSARVLLMGTRRQYRDTLLGSALAFLLIDRVRENVRRRGIRMVELSWVLEDNDAMRRVIESVGGHPYKTYRIYEKALA